jgi:hypothetical protein
VPGHEADHSPPSSAEIGNGWPYASTQLICFHEVGINENRDNYTSEFMFRTILRMNSDYFLKQH